MKTLPTALLLAALVVAPCQAITTPYVDPVWRPFIMLAGDGDPQAALVRLHRIKQLQNAMINNTKVDQKTQAFIDGMWRSMERFDLKGFYGLLPEQNGRQRMLNVSGQWHDNEYRYVTVNDNGAVESDSALSLGDVDIQVSATQLQSLTLNSRYLLSGMFRAGVGTSSWQTVRDAGSEILNAASYPPRRFVQLEQEEEIKIRNNIRKAYPLLGNKDVDFFVPLWQAFPNLADMLAALTVVEDVVVEDDNDLGYRSYTTQLVMDQDKLRSRYPHLAAYLDKVGNLVESTIDISDGNGRLVRIKVDTRHWRFTIETTLSFGGIVPTGASGLQLDNIRKFSDKPVDMTVSIDSRLDVLGVLTHVQNLRANLLYRPTDERATLEANINVVPSVTVDGAFLGVVPTGVIDFLIPGNIASIITEFFTVACEGNMGQGIVVKLSMQNNDIPGVSNVVAEGSVLAIDNPFIQLGMRIVNTRMIPDVKASDDLTHLFFASQTAFYQDFDLFMARRQR